MPYRNLVIENTFEAGRAVQRIVSFLAGNDAGTMEVVGVGEEAVTVEFSAKNPLVMAWIESELAPFV